jgi:hypothetical protein
MPQDLAAPPTRSRTRGVGRVLIVVYGILALAASGRSFFEGVSKFSDAPLAYSLSMVSAVVYIIATVALIAPGRFWYRVAWVTISFELLGVLTVGTLSIVRPDLFGQPSVWSWYGNGYLFIPLVLPVLGMTWLWHNRERPVSEDGGA